MERPSIHGQIRRMNLNPPSSWQGFKNCFLEVMSEWIRVRMEQEREEGKMGLYLLGESKCCYLREMVFSSLKNTPPPSIVLLCI